MRPTSNRRSVRWISVSTRASTEEVASSSRRIRGSLEQRARECDALSLATGECEPLLADDRLVPVRQSDDELVGFDGARRGFDVRIARARPGERDVVADGVGEEERVFEHDADLLAQRRERDVAHVDVVDPHRARVHVVEAGEQQADRGLSRAGRADERHGLARVHREREVAQDRLGAEVAERDVLERDLTPRGVQPGRVRPLLHERCAVEQLEDAFGTGPRQLRDREHAREHPHRRDESEHVAREREEHARG